MFNHRLARRSLIAIIGLNFFIPASAWDGEVIGRVAQVHVITGASGAPGAYDVRVYIENQPTICTGGPDWGYINSNDANYKGLMAALLMAQASGKTIKMFTVKSAAGYCQIGYLIVTS